MESTYILASVLSTHAHTRVGKGADLLPNVVWHVFPVTLFTLYVTLYVTLFGIWTEDTWRFWDWVLVVVC
jgi:hypothetical protein